MKYLFIVFVVAPLISVAQNSFETQLDSIVSIDEAQEFIETNKKAKGKVFIFNKEKHKTKLADELFSMYTGGKKVIQSDYKTTYYKIIDKNKVLHNRVRYILFDSAKMSVSEINALRAQIISRYKEGYEFKTLAKYYSMDINAKKGGDTGWYIKGTLHPDFEKAVESHSVDELFTLDLVENKNYYLILKSFETKAIPEITVLKFSESKK